MTDSIEHRLLVRTVAALRGDGVRSTDPRLAAVVEDFLALHEALGEMAKRAGCDESSDQRWIAFLDNARQGLVEAEG